MVSIVKDRIRLCTIKFGEIGQNIESQRLSRTNECLAPSLKPLHHLPMRVALFFSLFCLCAQSLQAETITVAVAANFSSTLNALAADFETDSEHRLRVVSGSSGKLFAQIVNGAPFDLFLSADECKPAALAARGLADASTQRTYAIGRLAVWAPSATALPLSWSDMQRIAIANPVTAPYGSAAAATLAAIDALPTSVKIVQAENVAQVYQFTASGNVDAGFVALAMIKNAQPALPGKVWLIPEGQHQPVRQDLIVVNRGMDRAAVNAFLAYLETSNATQLVEQAGYTLPVHSDASIELECP